MLSFVQNMFARACNPIGVDFGSDCLRMAQVAPAGGGEYKLIAAASADVPNHVRHDPAGRINFFVESIKELLASGKFRNRQAVLGLPASMMFIQHLRMPKLDADAMKKALPWELRGKLPIDPSHALLRHIVAGDVFDGQEPKDEVIVMAAAKETVNAFLAAASRAKLDIVGMNVEPKALVDCFTQIYRRKSDEGAMNCFVDIGCVGTRAVIARGTEIYFARNIPVGGDHFSRSTANGLKIKLEEAKLLRVRIAQLGPMMATSEDKPDAPLHTVRSEQSVENSFALLSAGLQTERRIPGQVEGNPAAPAAKAMAQEAPPPGPVDEELVKQSKLVEQACRDPLNRLVEELELCRRYYETTFPNKPIDRLVFVGGEARQRSLCQQIARAMGLAAQVGDPMVRLNKNSDVGIDNGIDRRQPQPGWAVAIGLSMGPTVGATVPDKAETVKA
ncbi:MAG: type pilus assembly protein PilM [Humisphaera sp.]|nr:type pilus assembly protein PilM [Humisphaera sp.]